MMLFVIVLIFIGYCQFLSANSHNQYDPTLNEKKIEKKDSISQTVLKIVNKAKGKVKLNTNKPEAEAEQSEAMSSIGAVKDANKQQINKGVL